MEDLNKYMNNVSTISSLRERVQSYVDLKEEYLKKDKLSIISSVDMEDNKKLTDKYKEAVDRNDEAIDLIIDIKNELQELVYPFLPVPSRAQARAKPKF